MSLNSGMLFVVENIQMFHLFTMCYFRVTIISIGLLSSSVYKFSNALTNCSLNRSSFTGADLMVSISTLRPTSNTFTQYFPSVRMVDSFHNPLPFLFFNAVCRLMD